MRSSVSDINIRLASIRTEIAHVQVDIDNIYSYLETLVTHVISPL